MSDNYKVYRQISNFFVLRDSSQLRNIKSSACKLFLVCIVFMLPYSSSHAALDGLTPFEIDANLCDFDTDTPATCTDAQHGVNDWEDPYGPGVNLDGSKYTGISNTVMRVDDGGLDGCIDWYHDSVPAGPDQNAFGGGAGASENPWDMPSITNPNNKTDFCIYYSATEVVEIPSTPTGAQFHNILYQGFAMNLDGSGTVQYLIPLFGDIFSTRAVGDQMLILDVDPSDLSGSEITIGEWNGGGWDGSGATFASNELDCSISTDGRMFVECAIDLTAIGVFPEDTCEVITVPGAMTLTGGSFTSQLKDFVSSSNPDGSVAGISNCGQMSVTKVAGGLDETFDYSIQQLDGEPVHDSSLSDIDGDAVSDSDQAPGDFTNIVETLTTQTLDPTDGWGNVLNSPDFTLTEPTLPVGWELVGMECTYYDPFLPGFVTEDLTIPTPGGVPPELTGSQFIVWPDEITINPDGSQNVIEDHTAACTITNSTSAVVVEKIGSGDATEDFSFLITDPAGGAGISTQIGGVDSPLSLTEVSDAVTYTPGTTVTIVETLPGTSPGWSLDDISCVADISGPIVPIEMVEDAIRFDTLAGEVITCTFENNQNGRLFLEKVWVGGQQNDSAALTADVNQDGVGRLFDSVVDAPSPANETDSDLTSVEFAPGDLIDIEETLTPLVGYESSLSCSGDGTLSPGATTSGTLTTASTDAGEDIICTFTNTALTSDLEVTKTVEGQGTEGPIDWSFDFALAPAATDGSDTSPATGTGNGSDVVNWTTLVPGTEYVLSETTQIGYTEGTLVCVDVTGGAVTDSDNDPLTVTFIAPLGDANDPAVTYEVNCVITNTVDVVEAQVTKIVAGVDASQDWSFDFSITPTSAVAPTLTSTDLASAGTGSVTSTDGVSWTGLLPGAEYVIAETTQAGYTAGEMVCAGVTDTDAVDETVTFIAPIGDSDDTTVEVDCTITNTALTSDLEVTKTVEGQGTEGPIDWSFDFALAPAATDGSDASPATGTGNGSDVVNWTALTPGVTYTLSETEQSGYTEGALTCDVADTDGDLTDLSVSFVAPLGDANELAVTYEVNCAITNTADVVEAQVTKIVEGVDASQDWSFDFSITPTSAVAPTLTSTDLASAGTGSVTSTDIVSWTGLLPGAEYVIAETTQAGYTAGAMVCAGVTDTDAVDETVTFIAPIGDSDDTTVEVDCTITNTALTSDLEVTKTVEGQGTEGPIDWSFDFALAPAATDGSDTSPATGTGNGSDVVNWTALTPGVTYTLSETEQSGYTEGALTCDVADTDGDLTDLSVSFVAPLGDANELAVTYEVNCAITNTADVVEAQVTKIVEGVDANQDWSFDFSITPTSADAPTLTSTDTASAGTGSVTSTDVVSWTGLLPGAEYVIAETTQAGYTAGAMVCAGVTDTDAVDETVTFIAPIGDSDDTTVEVDCTITNTALTSDLEVTKTVEGQGTEGPIDWSFDFTLAPAATDGSDASPATGTGNGSDVVNWTTLVPGTEYVLSETTQIGYTEGTLVCVDVTGGAVTDSDDDPLTVTFIAPLGDANDPAVTYEVNCAITNTADVVEAQVTKIVEGVDANQDWSFDFSITPTSADAPTLTSTDTASAGTGSVTSTDVVSWTGLLPSAEYVIAETTQAGYTAGAMVCAGVTDTDAVDETVTFIAPIGDSDDTTVEVDCTITNTALTSDLEVTKTVEGQGTEGPIGWSFDFALAPAATDGSDASPATGNGNSSDVVNWTALTPGVTYTLSETEQSGYTEGALTCDVADTDGDLTDLSVSFVAPIGDLNDPAVTYEVNCAITNTADVVEAQVTKIVEGVDASQDWSFDFSITPTSAVAPTLTSTDTASAGMGSVTSTDVVSWTGLLPGAEYVIAETTQAGYTAGAMVCAGVTDTDTVDETVTFIAPIGDSDDTTVEVDCTITNTALTSDLEVTKTVEGQGTEGPIDWSFDFALAPAATDGSDTSPATGTGNGSDVVNWTALTPGVTYTLSETEQSGYTEGALTCDVADTDGDLTDLSVSFVAPLGDANELAVTYEVNCAITNTADVVEAQVTKIVEGVDANQDWSFDFSITPTSADAPTLTSTDTASAGTGSVTSTDVVSWTGLLPGAEYVIAETTQAGYTAGAMVCAGVTDTDAVDETVTFIAPIGDSDDTTVEVDCTITNTALTSDLEVTKTVEGQGTEGPIDWSFDFTLAPAATDGSDASPATGTGNSSDVVNWTTLVPGTEYVLSETTQIGYTEGTLVCVDVTGGAVTDSDDDPLTVTFIAPLGDANDPAVTYEVNCAITNTADVVEAQVTKIVEGVDVSQDWSFDFSITPTSADAPTLTSTDTASAGTGSVTSTDVVSWTGLLPGAEYVVAETTQAGYTAGAMVCAGVTDTDAVDETVTFIAPIGDSDDTTVEVDCTITNTALTSDIEVTKLVEANSAVAWAFEFTLSPNATVEDASPATGAGTSSDTVSWTELVPGTEYTLTETAVSGFTAGALSCTGPGVVDTDGDLSNASVTFIAPFGDANDPDTTFEVNCTITNLQIPDLLVTKSVAPAAVIAGGLLTFTIEVSNIGILPATLVELTDILPASLILDSGTPPLASQGAFDAVTGIWTVGTVSNTDQHTLTLAVELQPEEGVCAVDYENIVSVTAQGETDFDETNHEANAVAQLISIAAAKTLGAGTPIDQGDGTYQISYVLLIRNNGGVMLNDIQVVDDLQAIIDTPIDNDATIDPASVTVTTPDPTFTLNPAYDGASDTNLLLGTDTLAPGAEGTIEITFTLTPHVFFGRFENQATVSAVTEDGTPVSDLSEDGASISTVFNFGTPQSSHDNCIVDSPTVFQLDIPTTPITLGWLKSSDVGGGQVLFEWSTEAEVGNVGYYLWSQDASGEWTKLNEAMIESQGDSLTVQDYSYHAYGVTGNSLRITDVDLHGKQVHHGPYQLGEEVGVRSERKVIDWDSINRESEELRRQREQQQLDELNRRLQGSTETQSLHSRLGGLLAMLGSALISPVQATELVNIDVDRAGIYRVTHAQLMDANLDLSGTPGSSIGLKTGNELTPMKLHTTGSSWGAGAYIEFAGRSVETLYTGTNKYTLVLNEGQRLIGTDDRAIPDGPAAYSYLDEVVYAEQNEYTHFSPDKDDAWYADRLSAITGTAQKTVNLTLDEHAPSFAVPFSVGGYGPSAAQMAAVKPKLDVRLWGASALPGNGVTDPDHHVTIELNGQQVADERFDGLRVRDVAKPLASVIDGDNQIKVTLPKDHGYAFDLVNLDQIRLSYPRRFKAKENGQSLVFASSWDKFRVFGLNPGDATVYRMDLLGEVDEMTVKEASCPGGALDCLVSFAGSEVSAQDDLYFVSTESGITNNPPQITLAPAAEDLFSGNAAYLIISHPDFIGANLDAYAADLASIYGSADIVSVESIFAQYSGQVLDANAIHAYVKDAYTTRGTQHVLLVGGDMYDYYDNLGSGAKSFVPSLYVQTGLNLNRVPSDAKYGDVDDDNIPEMGVARLPVRSNGELNTLLSKRDDYLDRGNGANNYAQKAVFSADKVDGVGYSFKADSEQVIAASFTSGWQLDRAYLDDLGADAKQTLIDAINEGSALTSYTGHSSTDKWSLDDLLSGSDVAGLSNVGKPTVVAQWGCWNTFFVSPEEESLSHRFLLEGDRGAVVVMGASSLTSADAEKAMSLLLYDRLDQGMRISDAVLSAKQAFAEDHPEALDVLLGWAVLGAADLSVN